MFSIKAKVSMEALKPGYFLPSTLIMMVLSSLMTKLSSP